MSDYIKQNSSEISFTNSENWVILNPIELSIKKKIEQYGTKLQDWDLSINRGILTGYNDAFIIDEATKNSLITADPKSAELIRPILRGKDINRYHYNFAKLWVIYIPCGFTNHKRNNEKPEEWFKNTYPSIYHHLVDVENELSKTRGSKSKGLYKRDDQGEYWWELRSCKYLDDFYKQKLVWTPVNSEYKFTIIPENYFFNNSIFMITGDDLYYLCGILNSTLYKKYFEVNFTKGNYNYGSASSLKKLPILKLPKEKHEIITELVKKNLSAKNEETYLQIDKIINSFFEIVR